MSLETISDKMRTRAEIRRRYTWFSAVMAFVIGAIAFSVGYAGAGVAVGVIAGVMAGVGAAIVFPVAWVRFMHGTREK